MIRTVDDAVRHGSLGPSNRSRAAHLDCRCTQETGDCEETRRERATAASDCKAEQHECALTVVGEACLPSRIPP